MPFAICNEIYQGWPLADALRHAARTGYDAVELAPFTLAPDVNHLAAADRARIRETALHAGLAVCGLHWVLAQTEGLHLTHPDAAVRARTGRYLADLAGCCADVGGRVVVVGSPKQRSRLPGVTAEQAWAHAADTFRDAVKRAEDRGVAFCFEPLSPAETDFVNTAAEAVRFAAQFASPAMQVVLDVKAMCSEAVPVPDLIRAHWPALAHFHANDRNLKGPGFGDVDFRPIAAALRDVGYAGYVSVEVFNFDEGAEAIAERSLAYLKRTWAEMGAAAPTADR